MQLCLNCGRVRCSCGIVSGVRKCSTHDVFLIFMATPVWGENEEGKYVTHWVDFLCCPVNGCGYSRRAKQYNASRTTGRDTGKYVQTRKRTRKTQRPIRHGSNKLGESRKQARKKAIESACKIIPWAKFRICVDHLEEDDEN